MATKIQIARTEEPQLRPNAIQLEDGQPVINFNEAEPGLYFKLRDNSLCKIGPVHVGPAPPNSSALGWPGNSIGEVWLDTANTIPQLRIWTGSGWTADSDVSIDTDQTITGQKTFTKSVKAQGGVDASGQSIFANSLSLAGTASSAQTSSDMEDSTLTTKGYVDFLSRSASLSNSLKAGEFIAGDDFNGTSDVTWSVDATSENSPNTLISRDFVGGFKAYSLSLSNSLKIGSDSAYAQVSQSGQISVVSPLNELYDVVVVSNTDGTVSSTKASIKADGSAIFAGKVGIGEVTAGASSLLELKSSTNTHQLQLTDSDTDGGWRFHANGPSGQLLNISRFQNGADLVKVSISPSGLDVSGSITSDNIIEFASYITDNISGTSTIAGIKSVLLAAAAKLYQP